jgi:hypothetical protein
MPGINWASPLSSGGIAKALCGRADPVRSIESLIVSAPVWGVP